MIEMTSRAHMIHTLDDEGYVVSRNDGPQGWDYKHGWRILGFLRRWNAGLDKMVPLDDALNGADVGQGWVVDWDHGTVRVWTSPSSRRLLSLRRLPAA